MHKGPFRYIMRFMDRPRLKPKNPRGYRGKKSTNHSAKGLVGKWLSTISGTNASDEIIAAWPEIVGPKFATMSEAVGLYEGVLRIRVKNSTLYTLFVQYEKERLRSELQARFTLVKDIDFKMG